VPLVPFAALPDHGRLWVFPVSRFLDEAERSRTLAVVDGFLEQWAAHGHPLRSGREFRVGRFLLVGVDVDAEAPSGCSIDALMGRLRALGAEMGATFIDHAPVWYQDGDEVRLRCAQLLAAAGDVVGARDRAARLTVCADKVVAGGAHLLAGRLAGRAKELPAAVAHWLSALELGQGGPEVHGLLGAHYHRVGEHAQAVRHLRERLRQGPPDPSLARALIRSHVALGELNAAREQLVGLVAQGGLDEQAERLITELARSEARRER